VAGLVGVRATLVGAGVLGGLVTFAFIFLPGMRDMERHDVLRRQPPGQPRMPAAAVD
jgi:hypothetical protein